MLVLKLCACLSLGSERVGVEWIEGGDVGSVRVQCGRRELQRGAVRAPMEVGGSCRLAMSPLASKTQQQIVRTTSVPPALPPWLEC